MSKCCSRCGEEKPLEEMGDNRCYACKRELTAEWRAAHPDRAEASAERSKPNKNAQQRAKRALDPQGAAAALKAWRAANSDKQKAIEERARLKAAADRETVNARHRLNYSARKVRQGDGHRAKIAVYNHRRRTRRAASGGTHNADDIVWLYKAQKGRCAHPWCRVALGGNYQVDHVVPLSIGGSNDRRNLALLCKPCNLAKNNKHPVDFAVRNGFLV